MNQSCTIADAPRGRRGVRAGRNRRYNHRTHLNPYQQSLMNVAELLVDFADSSTRRTRMNLERERQFNANRGEEEEEDEYE